MAGGCKVGVLVEVTAAVIDFVVGVVGASVGALVKVLFSAAVASACNNGYFP